MNNLKHMGRYTLPAVLLLGGCATVPENAGLMGVNQRVEATTGGDLVRRTSPEQDQAARNEIERLLSKPLTTEAVTRVALLNNYEVQTQLAGLGVARAQLLQASLAPNPLFHGEFRWEELEGKPFFDIGISQSIYGLINLPARKRAAGADFDRRQLEVSGAVLGLVTKVRAAVIELQAEKARCALIEEISGASDVSLDAAERLYAAGNITELSLDNHRAMAAEARLLLAESEMAVGRMVEKLNALMGLHGEQTRWELADALAEMPTEHPGMENLESQAIGSSLSLAAGRTRVQAAAERVGIENLESLFRHLEFGPAWEHAPADDEYGFLIGFEIPLFDVGQGQRAMAQARFEQQQAAYRATAVSVRSAVRDVRLRMQFAIDKARYTTEVLMPLAQRKNVGNLLAYNGMQIGVFRLIMSFNGQALMKSRLIDATRDYWLARNDMGTLLAGHMPAMAAMSGASPMGMAGDSAGGH